MQKIAAAILLLAFIGQSFNQGFYYITYVINKAEYVKRCENKKRPQLHCNGQCVLMKRIKEQERREQGQSPEMKMTAKTEVLSSKSSFLLNAPLIISSNKMNFFTTDAGNPIDQPSSFFHPPGA